MSDTAIYRSSSYVAATGVIALVSFAGLILHRFDVVAVHGPAPGAVDAALIAVSLFATSVFIAGASSRRRQLLSISRGFLHFRAGMFLGREVAIPITSVRSVSTDWDQNQADPPKNLIFDLDLHGIGIAKQSGVLLNSGGRWIFSLAVADKSPDEAVDLVRAHLKPNA